MPKKKFAHIVNPVNPSAANDLLFAQTTTFETLRLASNFAKEEVEVHLFSAQFQEDRILVPGWFKRTPDLDRSILDLGHFEIKRKLPLLLDILDRLYCACEADYLIFTNIDIGVVPHFYLAINKFIDKGYDAFVINRRTISEKYHNVDEIPLMLAEIGKSHPGHDCFVYKREDYEKFILGNCCIGVNWVGRVLLWNLIYHSVNFYEFRNEHLTFHMGDRKAWKKEIYSDYVEHNFREAYKVFLELESKSGPFDRRGPYACYFNEMYESTKQRDGIVKFELTLFSYLRSIIHF